MLADADVRHVASAYALASSLRSCVHSPIPTYCLARLCAELHYSIRPVPSFLPLLAVSPSDCSANALVAQRLAQACGPAAVLRRHPKLEVDRAQDILAFAAELGVPDFSLESAGAIHNSLLSAYSLDPEAGKVLETLITRPMKQVRAAAADGLRRGSVPPLRIALQHFQCSPPSFTFPFPSAVLLVLSFFLSF